MVFQKAKLEIIRKISEVSQVQIQILQINIIYIIAYRYLHYGLNIFSNFFAITGIAFFFIKLMLELTLTPSKISLF